MNAQRFINESVAVLLSEHLLSSLDLLLFRWGPTRRSLFRELVSSSSRCFLPHMALAKIRAMARHSNSQEANGHVLDAEVVRLIRERNQLDLALYGHASRLWGEQIRQMSLEVCTEGK